MQKAPVSKNLMVIARDAHEMKEAQLSLLGWAEDKIAYEEGGIGELEENLAHAKKNKWKWQGFQSQLSRAKKRIEYYVKIKAALEAGFVIVPSFPCDIIAIRTEYEIPSPHESSESWANRRQTSEAPALGKGEYKNSQPIVKEFTTHVPDPKDSTKMLAKKSFQATEFDHFDFPLKAVRPQILDHTSKALALKIFDEIGFVAPNVGSGGRNRPGTDPMIVGHVIFKQGYNVKRTAFLITWWLAASDLEVGRRRRG
jgi:hypothetical protein